MGCQGIRVEQPDEINTALMRALESNQPVVVEVVTEQGHMVPWPQPDFGG